MNFAVMNRLVVVHLAIEPSILTNANFMKYVVSKQTCICSCLFERFLYRPFF